MKICLLTDTYADSTSPFKEHDLPCDPRPYLPEADWERVALQKSTAVATIIELAQRDFDLFFNLCDGAWDEDRPGMEVVRALERLGVAFTGATSESRRVLPGGDEASLSCVGSRLAALRRRDDGRRRRAGRRRSALSAHRQAPVELLEHRSHSRLAGHDRRRAAPAGPRDDGVVRRGADRGVRGRARVHGARRREPGRPAPADDVHARRVSLPQGDSFKHFDLKWIEHGQVRSVPVVDELLDEQLRELAAKVFRGLNGAGFGRVDVRVDDEGRAFFLEINPNCGLYYPEEDPGSADLCLWHDPAGHVGFTGRSCVRR